MSWLSEIADFVWGTPLRKTEKPVYSGTFVGGPTHLDQTVPVKKMPTIQDAYHAAFGAVPVEMIRKIAQAAPTIDPTVKGLLLNLLAEHQDKACWMALADFAQEYVSRPNEVELDGRRIATSQEQNYSWWRARFGNDVVRALLSKFGIGSQPTYRDVTSRTMSLDTLCSKTPAELLALDWIKEKRLKKIQLFVGRLGLHLSGDQVHTPPEPEGEKATDDYGVGPVGSDNP